MSIKSINISSKCSHIEQKYTDLGLDKLNDKCIEIQAMLKKDKEDGKLDPNVRIELSSIVDKDNIKIYITYFIRDTDIVKKTRRVKVFIRKINFAIEERKKWAKFGIAKKGNDGITLTKDDVYFMKPDGKFLFKSDELKDKQNKPVSKIITKSGNAKPNAWKSRRVALRNNDPNLIVSPRKKFEFKSKRDDNDKTLFVSNLSTDTSLYTIFGVYGRVKFNNIPTYKHGNRSGESKGIAFVKFFNVSTTEKALAANGTYLDHMKIGVKLAKQDK